MPAWLFPGNWRSIFKLFSFKWKLVSLFLVLIICGSLLFWMGSIYFSLTRPVPKEGGRYSEGIIGQPAYINPLLSQTSEADADLTQLIYSGLFNYNSKGEIVEDLAERYETSEDKKTYTVYLRKNAKWHDGKALDASDVYFTISILKDQAYKSPLRFNWQGVEVRQVDDYTLEFSLAKPYFGFLDNLTVGILPKHIWENITPEKFTLTDYNLHPIGSGPYSFFDFQKDASGNILTYELHAFPDYYKGRANISIVTFDFYFDEDSDAIIDDYNKKEIMGMSSIVPEKISLLKSLKTTDLHEVNLPRYFSVLFNQKQSIPLADDKVREALAYATDRNEIIEKVQNGKGVAVHSPFLPTMEEFSEDVEKYDFNLEKANALLDEGGWAKGEDGFRQKGENKLEFILYTTDWPKLAYTADVLRSQWEKAGAKVIVNVLSVSDLTQNYIRPREYEAMLIGRQYFSFNPDPYEFWHSGEKNDPGKNIAKFENEEADRLLNEARESLAKGERVEKYKRFQEIIAKEAPVVFLYSPKHIYPVNKKVKGIDIENLNSPAHRFSNINNWYIKTKRVRK